MANVVLLTSPTPQIAIASDGGWGSISLNFPVPILAASIPPNPQSISLAAPVPTVTSSGGAGIAGSVVLTSPLPTIAIESPVVILRAPLPTISVSGIVGIAGTVSLSLPNPVLLTNAPDSARLVLPTPQLAVDGSTGVYVGVNLRAPVPALSIAGQTEFYGAMAFNAPLPLIQASGTVGNVGVMMNTLRSIALSISGGTGVAGMATMQLPLMVVHADGYQDTVGTVTLRIPTLVLQVNSDNVAASSFSTIVMHTESQGLTEYDNYPFNSYARFNGMYLGASDNGLFALSGNTDNGALIQAAARGGITDFSTSHLKRVDRCYVGYRTDGNMVLRVFTDEINVRDYLLTSSGAAGLHGNHLRIGKGLAARYWQFEIRNKDGSEFDLNMIELKPTILRRRIGGGDA